ncbi:MAG: hypothetical protein WAW73_17830 [Rhodoferax sp.]
MNANTAHASTIVDRIVSGWRGAPQVTIVESVSDLPVQGPSDVRGLFYRGGTWVVVDNQASIEVPRTLAHEVIGHHAMRDTLGGSWRSFMHAVQGGIRSGDWRLGYFQQDVRGRYTDGTGVCNLSPTQESDEIAAAVVELLFDGQSGRLAVNQPFRKIARAGLGHAAREGLYLDRPVCMDELLGTLLAAEHRLRFGGPLWGLGRRLRDWYAPRMPKFNPKAPPMSLRESERLLKAENDRIASKGVVLQELLSVGMVLGLIAFFALLWIIGSFVSTTTAVIGVVLVLVVVFLRHCNVIG